MHSIIDIMAISNIWITKKYQKKIEKMFRDFNVFEVDQFFQKHQFQDADEQTEECTQDHDITIVDEIGFETFVEHLPCYFSGIE